MKLREKMAWCRLLIALLLSTRVACAQTMLTTLDDSDLLQSMIRPNNDTRFRAGQVYNLCRLKPADGYPNSDGAAVIIKGLAHFHVWAEGATFVVCPGIALSQAFFFDEDRDWSWSGGTFIGSRFGLRPEQENVAFGLMNNVDFSITNIRVAGYGGNGAAFVGDWNINGQFSKSVLDGVGIGFDLAFSNNLKISNIQAVGGESGNPSARSSVGNKFFSSIYDIPLKLHNKTRRLYFDSTKIDVFNCNISNFATGIAISSGSDYYFHGNYIHDNPGKGSAKGIGYYIFYEKGGIYSSAGHAARNIAIYDEIVSNNGAYVPGFGVLISGPPANADENISDIRIVDSIFNNNISTAIGVFSFQKVKALKIMHDRFEGQKQINKLSYRGP